MYSTDAPEPAPDEFRHHMHNFFIFKLQKVNDKTKKYKKLLFWNSPKIHSETILKKLKTFAKYMVLIIE